VGERDQREDDERDSAADRGDRVELEQQRQDETGGRLDQPPVRDPGAQLAAHHRREGVALQTGHYAREQER